MIRDGKVKELRVLGEGLGAEIGAGLFFQLDGTTYYPIHDQRGSLVTLLQASKPAATCRYTAFGEELTTTKLSPWRFSSKRHDPESGFIYFGRRYYSPNLGRWMTPDPQGFQDGPNLYAYVKNSPSIDLYGLEERNGRWESFKGGCRATVDYFLDGFCRFGPWMESRMRNSLDMQWRTISDPIGHGKWLFDNASDFVRNIPSEMNMESFKTGCRDAATSCFPKTAKALSSRDQLDDYTRSYITQQSALEIVTAYVGLAATTTIGKNLSTYKAIQESYFERRALLGKDGITCTEAKAEHIFRRAEGHVLPPRSLSTRERYLNLFKNIAASPDNARPMTNLSTKAINADIEVYSKTYRNGKELWVEIRNYEIQNAGINLKPRYPE